MSPSQHEALERRDAVAGPDAALEAADERRRLQAAVMALAPRQRAMVVLRYYGDCSAEEIATALGCRPATVRATLYQALRRLRERGGCGGEVDAGTNMLAYDGGLDHNEG